MAKRGLGTNPFKGNATLGIFTPTENPPEELNDATAISISKIQLPDQQPRRYFDPKKLQQLAESIKVHGILEPLLVRPISGNQYELIAGERRYRAAKTVGLQEVPVIIREMTSAQAIELALVENLQREDLNPVEETEGILVLLAAKLSRPVAEIPPLLHRLAKRGSDNVVGNEETIATIESIFQVVGRMNWESFASHRLPLLNLPESILEAVRAGKIEYTKARALAKVKDPTILDRLLQQATEQHWSLNEIRSAINEATQPPRSASHDLKQQFSQISKVLKASSIWDDLDKQERLQELIHELQQLANKPIR